MYDYRKMTPDQKKAVVAERTRRRFPKHSPPHLVDPGKFRIVTAACYEHQKLLNSAERLGWFEQRLLDHLQGHAVPCAAWVVLPNHYHILVKIEDIKTFTLQLGQLHGRTSFEMNNMDNKRGRTCWYRCEDRCMRTERHYYTSLNYIHNNPVKHGYVQRWGDWPYSSFHWYLERKGGEWLEDAWREYPILNYGDKWDVF